jgi:hypothetical protein
LESRSRRWDDARVRRSPRGPGLAKARRALVVLRRRLHELALHDGFWQGLLESADVVSEGGRTEDRSDDPSGDPSGEKRRGAVYYGTTSVRCRLDRRSVARAGGARRLCALVLAHPHARLRLVRLAWREALSRAGAPLGPMQSEMRARVLKDDDGQVVLTIDIDVNADFIAA